MSSRLSSDEPTKTCLGSKDSPTISTTKCPTTCCPRQQSFQISKFLTSQKTKLNSTPQITMKHNWVTKILQGNAEQNSIQDYYTKSLQYWLQSQSRFATLRSLDSVQFQYWCSIVFTLVRYCWPKLIVWKCSFSIVFKQSEGYTITIGQVRIYCKKLDRFEN